MDSAQLRRDRFEAVAEEVFEPIQRYLRRRAGHDQAEDLLSEVMLTVWRRFDDLPPERALPWCYGIASRTLANSRRSQRRHLRLVERLESEPSPRAEPDHAETGPDADLVDVLSRLPVHDQEVLQLWAWEQLEPREIAVVLETSVNAATLRLSRARARLASQLSRQDSGAPGHERVDGTQETR